MHGSELVLEVEVERGNRSAAGTLDDDGSVDPKDDGVPPVVLIVRGSWVALLGDSFSS